MDDTIFNDANNEGTVDIYGMEWTVGLDDAPVPRAALPADIGNTSDGVVVWRVAYDEEADISAVHTLKFEEDLFAGISQGLHRTSRPRMKRYIAEAREFFGEIMASEFPTSRSPVELDFDPDPGNLLDYEIGQTDTFMSDDNWRRHSLTLDSSLTGALSIALNLGIRESRPEFRHFIQNEAPSYEDAVKYSLVRELAYPMAVLRGLDPGNIIDVVAMTHLLIEKYWPDYSYGRTMPRSLDYLVANSREQQLMVMEELAERERRRYPVLIGTAAPDARVTASAVDDADEGDA